MTKWSIEEKQEMMRLLAEGKSMRQVGEILGRSKNAIISQYNKTKPIDHIPLHKINVPWSEEETQKAAELWNSDTRTAIIAKILGRTEKAVFSYAKERKELFKPRAKVDISVALKAFYGTLNTEKPTPENTVIEYEYEEIPVPENAPLVSYLELKPHKCKWICDEFWDEFDIETSKCCGLDVENKHGSVMQRNYCEKHYKASVRIKD